MVWLPDGAMLVTERAGRVRRVVNGALEPTPIAGVPPVFASGQGGLLDIALHPQFAENQLVYFTYADGTASENRTRVARARYDGTALQDWQVIFEVTQAKPGGQHFGSRMAWLPDNTLLVSIGDGGNPPTSLGGEFIRLQAQNRQSYLGKVVRIRDDGSVPPDNPFANASDTAPAIWSYGHRNIQGLAVDSATNRVWASEHGSSGGDELNFVQTGRNYGWPRVTYSREYGSGAQIGEGESLPGLESPKVVWLTTVAPSGLAVYRGDRYPDWQGDVFAGGLVSQDVRHVNLDESGNVIGQESIPINARVRDVRQAPDGFLYLLTDEDNGKLIRLER
jgi:glucose/arabinose dehydrogenase